MASTSNKQNSVVVFPALLMFLAVVALVLAAASVQAKPPPAPTPPPPPPAAPTPSKNPCPSGFTNSTTFFKAQGSYLSRGVVLIWVFAQPPGTPGSSTTICNCYPTANTTIPIPFFGPIVVPNIIKGPLACVPAPK